MKHIKFIDAKHAKDIHQYKNIKQKLLKINAAVWFSKMCKTYNLTPNYVHIKINGKDKRSPNTFEAATRMSINQEMRFLYIKKRS